MAVINCLEHAKRACISNYTGLLITGSLVRTHSGASFVINFRLIIPGVCLAQFSLNNVHKRGLKHHFFSLFFTTSPECCPAGCQSDFHWTCCGEMMLFYASFGGGRRSSAVACWASDHWVASSNPLRGKFRH